MEGQTGGNFIHGNVLLLWHTVDVGGLINKDLHQFPLATNRLLASRTLDNNVPFNQKMRLIALMRFVALRLIALKRAMYSGKAQNNVQNDTSRVCVLGGT